MQWMWDVAPYATSSSGSRLAEEGCEAWIHQAIVLRSPILLLASRGEFSHEIGRYHILPTLARQ